MRQQNWIKILVTVAGIAAHPLCAWAETEVVVGVLSVGVLEVAEASLMRDANSVNRGSAGNLVFDKYDYDTNPQDGSREYMYAPYRSESGMNWHLLQILANGTQLSLTAIVTGSVGSHALKDRISVWCGGFYPDSGGGPVGGTASAGWESLDSFSRNVTAPFSGVVPFNYRLHVAGVTAGAYNGKITFTLVSN